MHRTLCVVGLATLCLGWAVPGLAQVPDHLKCYKVKDTLKIRGTLDLTSPQFGLEAGCKVSSAALFCVPASESNVRMTNKATRTPIAPLPFSAAPSGNDRICYKLKCPKPATPIPRQSVTDQFGNRTVTKFIASLLCTPAVKRDAFCGNGSIDPDEECDGTNLGGGTCASQGLATGALKCGPGCRYDTSGCIATTVPGCGSGVQEGAEQCDGADLGGATCQSLGFATGALGCTAGCGFDVHNCVASTCGDHLREGVEQCDGPDLGGATCQSLGYLQGTLACTAGCGFDTSGCNCSTGECSPAKLPATGQTTCWDGGGNFVPCAGTGQDGDLQRGAPLTYVDNGDGTITDVNTALVWEKQSSDGSIHDMSNTYTWARAFSAHVLTLNATRFAGHKDWRMPNERELQSLVDFERYYPTIHPAFNSVCKPGCTIATCSCTQQGFYWSSTNNSTRAWIVAYSDGSVGTIDKSANPAGVRAVRGGSVEQPTMTTTTTTTIPDTCSQFDDHCGSSCVGQGFCLAHLPDVALECVNTASCVVTSCSSDTNCPSGSSCFSDASATACCSSPCP